MGLAISIQLVFSDERGKQCALRGSCRNVSSNQLNQKFELKVEAPRYVTYSNMPLIRELFCAKSVNAAQTLFVLNAEYST